MRCPLCTNQTDRPGYALDECECGARLEICLDCGEGDVGKDRAFQLANAWPHSCRHPGQWADEFRARAQKREALTFALAARVAIEQGDPERARMVLQRVVSLLVQENRLPV